MAKDFKVPIKLAVDGEAEFKKAMSECSKAMGLLSAEGKLVSATYKDNANSMEALSAKYDVANNKLAVQKEKVDLLREALAKEVEKSGEASAKSIDLAKQLTNAEATLVNLARDADEAGKAYNSHNDAVARMQDKYQEAKKGLNEFKEAHPKLIGTLETTGKAIATISTGIGKTLVGAFKVGAAAFSTMTAGAVAVGKAVFNAAEDASAYGDAVDKASQRMNVSAESYQKLAYAADLSGVSMQTMESASKALQKSGSELSLDDAIAQVSAIGDESARTQKAMELFGSKAAYAMAPLFNAGPKGFKEMQKAAEDFGLVMSQEAVTAAAAFNDTKTTLTNTVSMIKTNLASELMPGINEVMEGITGLFTGDDSATQKIEDGITKLMEDMGEVTDKIVNIITSLIDKIVEIAPTVITSLASGLLNNLDKLIDAAFDIVDALINGLLTQENIQTIMEGAIKLIGKLVTFLSENVSLLVKAAITIVTTLIGAFTEPENLNVILHGAIDMVGEIVTALIENAPMLIDAALEMGSALVGALVTYDWVSLAKSIYNSIKNSIIGFFKGNDNGSTQNAGGLDYVPYDGYTSTLHRGERVLTAAEAEEMRTKSDYSSLERKVDYLLANQNSGDVNINVSGSAGAIVRALNVEIDRENKRKSAFR